MSSVRDKRTSLEYGYRASVRPGQSFQNFQRTIPYQWIDNGFILKHSEFKAPYSVDADSYAAMEYQIDTPPTYPDIKTPVIDPDLPIWRKPKPVSPIPRPSPLKKPMKPPRPGNKSVNPNSPKLTLCKTGIYRNMETWVANRHQPTPRQVADMKAYSNFYDMPNKIVVEKPTPGGGFSRRFIGSPGWQVGMPRCGELPTCEGETIGYVSQQMSVDESQNLTVVGGCSGVTYSLALVSGGGSISGWAYTAPATNVDCANNPTINLLRNGEVAATVKFAVNGDTRVNEAYREKIGCVEDGNDMCPEGNFWCCSYNVYKCSNEWVNYAQSITGTCTGCDAAEQTIDNRGAGQFMVGCCPAGLL